MLPGISRDAAYSPAQEFKMVHIVAPDPETHLTLAAARTLFDASPSPAGLSGANLCPPVTLPVRLLRSFRPRCFRLSRACVLRPRRESSRSVFRRLLVMQRLALPPMPKRKSVCSAGCEVRRASSSFLYSSRHLSRYG